MKKRIITIGVVLMIISSFVLSPVLFASNVVSQSDVCQGVAEISNSSGCAKSSGTEIDAVLALVLNLFSAVVGLVAIIMIIIGGMKYVTSSGNPERTNEAKNAILYAVIGLIIVALAQIIVKFVLHKAAAL